MAKKTSKQGKKANKNTEKAVEAASQSPIVDDKADKKAEKAEKAAKAQPKEQPKAQAKPQSQAKTSKSSKQPPKKDGVFKRILTYFKNVRLEIKRTTWPSRNEVFRMSLIVIGALLFFGIIIFGIDWVMTRLLEVYAGLVPSGGSTPIEPLTALDLSVFDVTGL